MSTCTRASSPKLSRRSCTSVLAVQPITDRSATDLARAIRERELTAREVVEAHIEQARRENPRVNALVAERFDEALSEADAADDRVSSGDPDLPPLLGVPCTIKESFA